MTHTIDSIHLANLVSEIRDLGTTLALSYHQLADEILGDLADFDPSSVEDDDWHVWSVAHENTENAVIDFTRLMRQYLDATSRRP